MDAGHISAQKKLETLGYQICPLTAIASPRVMTIWPAIWRSRGTDDAEKSTRIRRLFFAQAAMRAVNAKNPNT